MADTAVDFFLENLKQLMIRVPEEEGYRFSSIVDEETNEQQQQEVYRFSSIEKNKIEALYEDLGFLRSFIKDSEKKRYEHAEVKDLVSQVIDLAHEAEDIIDLSIVSAATHKKRSMAEKIRHLFSRQRPLRDVINDIKSLKKVVRHLFSPQRTLRDVINDIKSLKKVVTKIYEEKLYGMGVAQVEISSHGGSSRAIPLSVEEEIVVGFDDEAEEIKDRLTGASQQLEIISIVGMAGLCKTTLARKLYNDPFIIYHFYIRGWTCVSQAYRKRDLLLGILSSEHKDEIYSMSDEKLEEELYRSLKERRYLVVIDDIWHIEAWNDLKRSFPDDNNGSRIMFTTRDMDMAKPDRLPLSLRFLTEDESWDLLQQKVFLEESLSCPPGLAEIGKQIAKKCGGLPLAIVVIAGLLAKTEKTQNWWNQVSESVSSYIVSDPQQQCMYTLSLSYNHLPHHLKSCFLYFGAFPEDYEIRVRKLTWLWIAEGFIHQIGNKSLEDVAEEYLMELIDRSLVLAAKRRSTGGISACRVHDLLRDLCLTKAKEENFLQIYTHEEFRSFSSVIAKNQRRLCIHSRILDYISLKPSMLHIRSFLCFASEQKNMSFFYGAFKLLRVLDLSVINIPIFPNQILNLVLLRYLAIRGKGLILAPSISNLWNLETLIVKESTSYFIPGTVWKMVKLRHLCIGGQNYFEKPPSIDGYPSVWDNLQTITYIQPLIFCTDFFARTPNLRKLGFCGNLIYEGHLRLPDLDFLDHLETLKLLNRRNDGHSYNLQGVKFPWNLKRLTLSNTALEWKEMSTLGMLPNLESLKLEFQACVGPQWETSDGGFRQLKFLRFYYMNIEEWNASNIHFPSLQCLVLHKCGKLKEIPSEFGDISTLQTIEVSWCSHSTVNSARQIQEEQESMGNDWLKILIYPRDWELTTYS